MNNLPAGNPLMQLLMQRQIQQNPLEQQMPAGRVPAEPAPLLNHGGGEGLMRLMMGAQPNLR